MNQFYKTHKPTLTYAFYQSLPIMSGFIFLGIAYGVYMNSLGFGVLYPTLMALFIFAGSVEFIVAGVLLSTFNPLAVFLLVFMISGRQIFYGISMLDKFKDIRGIKRLYLISAMTDESFAINYTATLPESINKTYFMLFVTLFLHAYWVFGAFLGGILGDVLPINLKGSEFAMTALFLVIFMEQWLKEKNHLSSLIGIIITVLSLLVFGKDSFLIPAMAGILVLLTLFKKRLSI